VAFCRGNAFLATKLLFHDLRCDAASQVGASSGVRLRCGVEDFCPRDVMRLCGRELVVRRGARNLRGRAKAPNRGTNGNSSGAWPEAITRRPEAARVCARGMGAIRRRNRITDQRQRRCPAARELGYVCILLDGRLNCKPFFLATPRWCGRSRRCARTSLRRRVGPTVFLFRPDDDGRRATSRPRTNGTDATYFASRLRGGYTGSIQFAEVACRSRTEVRGTNTKRRGS
jgi:hypothetical protein